DVHTTIGNYAVQHLPLNVYHNFQSVELLSPGVVSLSAITSNSVSLKVRKRLHIEMQAQQLAYADLRRYVGDPRFVKVPVSGMLSIEYAETRSKLIDLDKTTCDFQAGSPPGANTNLAVASPHPGTDTSYLTTVDRDGNIVSVIQSLAGAFG